MNSSVDSADRATHLRIIVTALLASLALELFARAVAVGADTKYTSVVRAQPRANVELSAHSTPVADRT